MEISYKLEYDDLSACLRYQETGKTTFNEATPIFRPYLLPLLGTGIILFKFLRAWSNYGFDSTYLSGDVTWTLFCNWVRMIFIVTIANLFIWMSSHAFSTSRITKVVLRFLGLDKIETINIRLQEKGLYSREKHCESLMYWSKFSDMVNDENYLLFLIGDKGEGLVVPKRAFANNALANEFFNRAIAFWKLAGGSPPQTPPIPAPDGN